ncbi:g2632 [Coccomyxa viridis]|uniref:G2632 protein n=1 Tax=Coccomyxa viridis TaxID=1274662 RepID=A0ABP1FST3_9CHLO
MENDSELVLERIMEDGTFDELRKKIVERVKQDEELNAFIEEAVFNSKALASTKADSKGRQGDVYNSVRKEIESKALDRALQTTWKVLQDEQTGLSATIEQKVHEALCVIYEQRAK